MDSSCSIYNLWNFPAPAHTSSESHVVYLQAAHTGLRDNTNEKLLAVCLGDYDMKWGFFIQNKDVDVPLYDLFFIVQKKRELSFFLSDVNL